MISPLPSARPERRGRHFGGINVVSRPRPTEEGTPRKDDCFALPLRGTVKQAFSHFSSPSSILRFPPSVFEWLLPFLFLLQVQQPLMCPIASLSLQTLRKTHPAAEVVTINNLLLFLPAPLARLSLRDGPFERHKTRVFPPLPLLNGPSLLLFFLPGTCRLCTLPSSSR